MVNFKMFFIKFCFSINNITKKMFLAFACIVNFTTFVQVDAVEDPINHLTAFIDGQTPEVLSRNAGIIFEFLINSIGNNLDMPKCSDQNMYKNLLKKCLSKGLDPNIVYAGEMKITPLHHAAFLGLPEVVELLLTQGADYRAVDSIGHDALWYADPATHAEKIKIANPAKYVVMFLSIIPVVGGLVSIALHQEWQNHQLCYELLMKAQDPSWKPKASSSEIECIKKVMRSDVKKLFELITASNN